MLLVPQYFKYAMIIRRSSLQRQGQVLQLRFNAIIDHCSPRSQKCCRREVTEKVRAAHPTISKWSSMQMTNFQE